MHFLWSILPLLLYSFSYIAFDPGRSLTLPYDVHPIT
jgi:hypothetical protein